MKSVGFAGLIDIHDKSAMLVMQHVTIAILKDTLNEYAKRKNNKKP